MNKKIVFVLLLIILSTISVYAVSTPVIPEGDLHTCTDLLGTNLKAVVKTSITVLQIAAAIIAIIKGMMLLIPPIVAKDADALKKAGKILVNLAIVLIVIFLFKPVLAFIGNLLQFDSSCI